MITTSRKPHFDVVGVGASAGGLEALRRLFLQIPDAPGFAVVVVVHLSPEHESRLVELLQPCTAMPVKQVTAATPIEPNHVYVIPPNANLDSIDTHLRLSELETRRINRAPINHFFRTLAASQGENAVGVILTGTGSDGALGIRQIREHGGLTIAQHPQEAEYPSMPECAIATDCVDLILPLAGMPGEIAAYHASKAAIPWPADASLSQTEALLVEKIIAELRRYAGDDIALYRREVVLRRISRRMRVRHVAGLDQYLELVRGQAEEAHALHTELLANVTEFFSGEETYRALDFVLEELFSRKNSSDEQIRIWTIGCSTGEEAYSIAMMLVEKAGGYGGKLHLRVFASELSPEALHRAREGLYPLEISAHVSAERLARFFVLEGERYRVRNDLRAIVTFSSHNLFKDPPYGQQDVIVCRNLFRDLEPGISAGVLKLIHYALNSQGVLFVDPRDNLETAGLFEREAAEPRVVRRIDAKDVQNLQLPSPFRPFVHIEHPAADRITEPPAANAASLFHTAIDPYMPASVLVDVSHQVVHFSAAASRYVRMPGGEPTLDIFNLVSPVIAYQLSEGFMALRGGARIWRSERFPLERHGIFLDMLVRLDRIGPVDGKAEHFLIVFDDAQLAPAPGMDTVGAELERARGESVRATLDELGNTREELQAVNEELRSVVDENQHRLTKLSQLTDDLKHLLESTGLATLLLDRTLNIVRFTPLAAKLFRIKPTDIGRPLADLKHELSDPRLLDELRGVLKDLSELEREVESRDGYWFLLRAQPYRGALQEIEGVVLVLFDISARKRAELRLHEADRNKNEFLAMLAHELRNPLAPIRAGVEVLRSPSIEPKVVTQIAAVMGRQTQQLVRLVDDLLEVGRINTGKLELRIESTRIAEVVRDAIVATRPFVDGSQHALATFISEEELIVDGDPARLTQIVANLLTNAARYTPPKGEISVTTEQAGDEVVIRVKDSGRGISAEALPRLFDMFYQDRLGARDQNGGLGIGLTLAKKLVELHAGTIEARSAGVNRGSTFTVRLPISRKAVKDSSTTAKVTVSEPEHRILIVDDNTDAAESMCMLLTSVGKGDVKTAFSGEEALKVGPHLCPDVVLLDLGMPGMDGYELARRIRREPWGRDILLVALTGWGQEQHRHQTKDAGFDRHLTKPADLDALLAVLNERVH